MAEIILFHHVQGLGDDVHAFADELRAAGHEVHVPDLLAGRTFPTIPEGIAHVQEIGFDTIVARGRQAVEGLPDELVYIGISLGVIPAQLLAQTRPGAQAAVFLHSAIPPSELGSPWPADVPAQIHLASTTRRCCRRTATSRRRGHSPRPRSGSSCSSIPPRRICSRTTTRPRPHGSRSACSTFIP